MMFAAFAVSPFFVVCVITLRLRLARHLLPVVISDAYVFGDVAHYRRYGFSPASMLRCFTLIFLSRH